MSHFAKVENGVVSQVIVAEQDFINSGAVGDPTIWVRTSYNTRGGVHYGPDGQPDGGVALRANYANRGDTYDAVNDVFYGPRPVDYNNILCRSFTLNRTTWLWIPPTPYPTNNKPYNWDEAAQVWVELTPAPTVT
jgi:hypothetical protein